MKISAKIENGNGEHHVTVTTNGTSQSLTIPAKASGLGSSVNGGELLFLALATCYGNDLYREAGKRGITSTMSRWRSRVNPGRKGKAPPT